jgi:RNase H-fold protein (predicted Holliday junction resolvase)
MNDGMISYPVETIVFSENNFLSAFQKIKKIVIFQNELTGIDLVVFGYPFHLKNFKSKFFKTIKFLEEKLHRFFVKENKKIEIFG